MVSKSQQYEVLGPAANMYVDEGVFTPNDAYKDGGAFASPLTASGTPVALVTGRDMTVIKATASMNPIGFIQGIPSGGEVVDTSSSRYSRVSSVKLFGVTLMEVECATASAVAVGDHVTFSAAGGTFANGTFASTTTSNGTIALQAYATASGAGQRILVLFGAYSV